MFLKINYFCAMTNEQHKELIKRVEEISVYLKISDKKQQLREEELRSQDPNFWDDPQKAEKQMKIIRGLKYWVDSFDRLNSATQDLAVLMEFVRRCC